MTTVLQRQRCWMVDRPATAHEVESEDEITLPDAYVAKHCRCEVGDTYFVETEKGALWRVDCISGWPIVGLITVRTTRTEIEAGLAAAKDNGRLGPMFTN